MSRIFSILTLSCLEHSMHDDTGAVCAGRDFYLQEISTMADQIRIGIVGATVTQGGSGWGANAHVPALHILPNYKLQAVCTSREETAEASKAKFGAELAFHDIDAMVNHPDVDLIVVCVRVPGHKELVMAGLHANKAVLCEWPLGADLAEAQEMASFAKDRGLKTIVGLQARSDPTLMYARDLINEGYIGEVLTANLSVMSQQALERGAGRIWQGERKNGANTLTISGGHAIDGLCYVLGEFEDLAARVATRIKTWKSTETGQDVPVDSPDSISIAGVLKSGAEVAVQVAAMPFNPSGTRLEIYGREGTMVISGPRSFNIGPNVLYAAQGKAPLADMPVPDKYLFVPKDMPSGPAYNVAQAYARATDALRTGGDFDVDFDLAVTRHKLIDSIERSSGWK
jgi:predicted dehydrogenase